MKINKDNYEAYFLDYVEGRLDNSSMLEMLAFLRNHPHLKDELESFADVKIPIEEEIFSDKDFLTKFDFTHTSVNQGNFEDYCIAYHEKILTQSDTEKLLTYLANYPDKRKSFDLFGKAILKADPGILFKGKSDLLRKNKSKVLYPIVLRWTAVAAGVALLVSVFFLYESKYNSTKVVERSVVKSNYVAPAKISRIEQNRSNSEIKASVLVSSRNNKIVNQDEQSIVANIEFKDTFNTLQPIEELNSISIQEIERTVETRVLVSTESTVEQSNPKTETLENVTWETEEDRLVKKVFKKTGLLPKKKITLWDIAQVTIKGYNSLSEKDIKLSKKTDEDGKLTAIALETENRKYGFKARD